MPSFWNKIKNIFQPEDNDTDDDIIDVSYPVEAPMDERYAELFVKGGGHFLYCENISFAIANLKEVLISQNFSRLVCFDPKLQKILNTLGITHIDYPSVTADGCFISCESLIAYNGSIMLSSHQLNGRGLKDLSLLNYIIYATPEQIEENLKDAMTNINRKKSGHLPTGITSIGGVDANQLEKVNYKNPNIFLLLVEES